MSRLFIFIRQRFLTIVLSGVILLAMTFLFLIYWFPLRGSRSEILNLKNQLGKVSKEYEELKGKHEDLEKGYDQLESDRNNILVQTKQLIGNTNRLTEAKRQLKKLSVDHKKVLTKSHQVATTYKQMKKENEGRIGALTETLNKTEREHEGLKSEFSKLQKQKSDLEVQLKDSRETIKKLERDLNKMKDYEKKYGELKEKNRSLKSDNKKLAKELKKAPKKFKTMASQNMTLIRETADMHYNLGVFYSEQKRFDLAISEFKKAIDLNPWDLKAHYNLGYIYAEQYQNHKLAVDHFRKYLGLASNDESADWVRHYLAERKVYDGKVLKS